MKQKIVYNSYYKNKIRYMECQLCGQYERVSDETFMVKCSKCVQIIVGPPEDKKKKSLGRPAGWHFIKEFVDKKGNVFHKGKEIPGLKGTLSPTKINKTTKRKKKSQQKDNDKILINQHKKATKIKRKQKAKHKKALKKLRINK